MNYQRAGTAGGFSDAGHGSRPVVQEACGKKEDGRFGAIEAADSRSAEEGIDAETMCVVSEPLLWSDSPDAISIRQVRLQPKEAAIAAGEIGSRLPDFSVKDLQGQPLSSADLRGKVVLIDFWATWCQPCKKEMPGYQKLADRYGSRGFVVIGFKFDMMPDTEDPLQFAESNRSSLSAWPLRPTR